MEVKDLHVGDVCPNCGSPFALVTAPTAEQRAAAARHEEPMPLPPHLDTATEQVIADKGALYRCTGCPYKARLLPEGADQGDEGEANGGKKRKR
jgi:hypothetical protein